MPKELINSKYENETAYCHVGWTKDRDHVELSTIAPHGQIAPWDEELQKHVPLETATPGWFIQMDRAGINRMIRVLRKARDEAFGADA